MTARRVVEAELAVTTEETAVEVIAQLKEVGCVGVYLVLHNVHTIIIHNT